MSTTADPLFLPPAGEALIRAHGITELRYASAGRLVGHVADDKDMLDIATFDVEVADLLGARVMLFSDGVLSNPGVSPDLVEATLL